MTFGQWKSLQLLNKMIQEERNRNNWPSASKRASSNSGSSGLNLSGANWNRLTAHSRGGSYGSGYSSSYSSSESWGYSGLPSEALQTALPTFRRLNNLLTANLGQVRSGRPNRGVLKTLEEMNQTYLSNLLLNRRPVINSLAGRLITNLANRGVLDSSVASKALSNTLGKFITDYINTATKLELERQKEGLYWPLKTLGVLSSLTPSYGSLLRVAQNRSKSSGSNVSNNFRVSFNESYNPAPAVGLLTSLMGI